MRDSESIDFLSEHWYGWKLRGRYLVAPDGRRLTRERLVGLLWRDDQELRRAGYASRRAAEEGKRRQGARQLVKVVVVQLGDLTERGSSAG